MTEIQLLSEKRNLTGYTEVTYKLIFTLPAVFGTGSSPIDGLSKIVNSYPDGFALEIIPVVGSVITFTETKSPDTTLTLAQLKTFVQGRYSTIRTQLDALALSSLDTISGLSWDGTNWTSVSLITDNSLSDGQTLGVTATGAAAAAVTLTLPAVVGKFHNISHLSITAYSTVARTGGVTPVIVTSTNLPGNPAFTFASAAAIGTTDTKIVEPIAAIKSSVANTATTIVCPATASIIWRIQVFYYTST